MRLVSLFRALSQAMPSRVHRTLVEDATLWQDAEFRIMLSELRYLPVRRWCDSSAERRLPAESREHRKATDWL